MAMWVYCSGSCGRREWRTDVDGYAGYLCASCAQGQRVQQAPSDGNGDGNGGWFPCLVVMLIFGAVAAGLTTAVLGVVL